MGDAPGDVLVMREVWEAGDAYEREPGDVEFRAPDVVLVVNVGDIDKAVRISCHQWFAGSCAAAVDRPVVAAGVEFEFRESSRARK